jgi:hypothetical protein
MNWNCTLTPVLAPVQDNCLRRARQVVLPERNLAR